MVFFDLPAVTRNEVRIHAKFRKNLLKDGFGRFQLSVYVRFCGSDANAEAHKNRIRKILPPRGRVDMLTLTDTQFARIERYEGHTPEELNPPPQQLELF